jgi:hypothetical protein
MLTGKTYSPALGAKAAAILSPSSAGRGSVAPVAECGAVIRVNHKFFVCRDLRKLLPLLG